MDFWAETGAMTLCNSRYNRRIIMVATDIAARSVLRSEIPGQVKPFPTFYPIVNKSAGTSPHQHLQCLHTSPSTLSLSMEGYHMPHSLSTVKTPSVAHHGDQWEAEQKKENPIAQIFSLNFSNTFLWWKKYFIKYLVDDQVLFGKWKAPMLISSTLVAQSVKKLPAMQETHCWGDPLQKEVATHSSILA